MTPGFPDGGSYPESWHAFIDWNQDGDFVDANERKYVGSSTSQLDYTLSVPSNAKKGLTKIRITMDYFGGSTNPCADVFSGEVEDYLLYVK